MNTLWEHGFENVTESTFVDFLYMYPGMKQRSVRDVVNELEVLGNFIYDSKFEAFLSDGEIS